MKIEVPTTPTHDLVLASRQETLSLERPGGFPAGTRITILVGERDQVKS